MCEVSEINSKYITVRTSVSYKFSVAAHLLHIVALICIRLQQSMHTNVHTLSVYLLLTSNTAVLLHYLSVT